MYNSIAIIALAIIRELYKHKKRSSNKVNTDTRAGTASSLTTNTTHLQPTLATANNTLLLYRPVSQLYGTHTLKHTFVYITRTLCEGIQRLESERRLGVLLSQTLWAKFEWRTIN